MKVLNFLFIILSASATIFSCNNIIKDPEVLINKYLISKSISEKLNYVSDTAEVKSLMHKYYQTKGISELIDIIEVTKIDDSNLPDNIQLHRVEANYKNTYGRVERRVDEFYVIDYLDKEMKIDWLSSTGNNLINFKSFQLAKSSEIGIFRFVCKLSDYYNYGYYGKQNKYYSVECAIPSEKTKVYCYIAKSSDDGKRLFELLKDGASQNLVLAVKYDYRSIDSDEILSIKKLVSSGWYYDETTTLSIPETLQDYILNSNMDTTVTFVVIEEKNQSDPLVRQIKYEFNRDKLLIITEMWFQGRRFAVNKEVCNLDDEMLEVTSFRGDNIFSGISYDDTKKALVKMPKENEKTSWSYTNKDGYIVSCISEFVEIEFNGKKNKAIKVTERSSYLRDAYIERLYIKDFGFYNEIVAADDGRIFYQLKLSEYLNLNAGISGKYLNSTQRSNIETQPSPKKEVVKELTENEILDIYRASSDIYKKNVDKSKPVVVGCNTYIQFTTSESWEDDIVFNINYSNIKGMPTSIKVVHYQLLMQFISQYNEDMKIEIANSLNDFSNAYIKDSKQYNIDLKRFNLYFIGTYDFDKDGINEVIIGMRDEDYGNYDKMWDNQIEINIFKIIKSSESKEPLYLLKNVGNIKGAGISGIPAAIIEGNSVRIHRNLRGFYYGLKFEDGVFKNINYL